jgi:hypothetical protein
MEYFTEKERQDLLDCIKDIENVSILIRDRDKGSFLSVVDKLSDRKAFFGKAKLWHVIKNIIEAIYLDALIEGKLELTKQDYTITVKQVKNKKVA